jgi:hypothetical protein
MAAVKSCLLIGFVIELISLDDRVNVNIREPVDLRNADLFDPVRELDWPEHRIHVRSGQHYSRECQTRLSLQRLHGLTFAVTLLRMPLLL